MRGELSGGVVAHCSILAAPRGRQTPEHGLRSEASQTDAAALRRCLNTAMCGQLGQTVTEQPRGHEGARGVSRGPSPSGSEAGARLNATTTATVGVASVLAAGAVAAVLPGYQPRRALDRQHRHRQPAPARAPGRRAPAQARARRAARLQLVELVRLQARRTRRAARAASRRRSTRRVQSAAAARSPRAVRD